MFWVCCILGYLFIDLTITLLFLRVESWHLYFQWGILYYELQPLLNISKRSYLKHVWNLSVDFKHVSNRYCKQTLLKHVWNISEDLKHVSNIHISKRSCLKHVWNLSVDLKHVSNKYFKQTLLKHVWNLSFRFQTCFKYISDRFQMKPVWNMFETCLKSIIFVGEWMKSKKKCDN